MKKDVSFIVLTYEQRLDWTLITIHSILIQKDIRFEIIIADDGSKNNNKKEIIEYFKKKDFSNYFFLDSDSNQGTVANLARCINYCNAKYIKLISPGDNIYGEYSIRQWINYCNDNDLDVSFCEYFTYYYKDDEVVLNKKSHHAPYDTRVYDKLQIKKMKRNMLIYNDLILGASTLVKTDVLFKYLGEIQGKLWYNEDAIYRIMVSDGMKIGHFKNVSLMYESYSGVSFQSNSNEILHQKQMDDWYTASKIISENHVIDKQFKRKFDYVSKWKRNSTVRRCNLKKKSLMGILKEFMPLYCRYPSLFFWHVKVVLCPNLVEFECEKKIVDSIMRV